MAEAAINKDQLEQAFVTAHDDFVTQASVITDSGRFVPPDLPDLMTSALSSPEVFGQLLMNQLVAPMGALPQSQEDMLPEDRTFFERAALHMGPDFCQALCTVADYMREAEWRHAEGETGQLTAKELSLHVRPDGSLSDKGEALIVRLLTAAKAAARGA